MALEKAWVTVPPQPFTANGTQFGLVTVADTAGFKVKASVYLINNMGATLACQIKRVNSSTQLIVGAIDNNLGTWKPLDISSWTVASGSNIGQQEQQKVANPMDGDHYRAIYESDPTVADRVITVDPYGNFYDITNPFPVSFDGTVSIGEVSIVDKTTDTPLTVNADGSINVVVEPVPVAGQQVVSTYGEVIAVPSGSTMVIVTYTVPPNTQAVLQRVPFSGENIGRYDLLINNVIRDRTRTMFGADLSGEFNWETGNDSGFVLNAGDIVTIQVNNPRPYIANYDARIQVLQIAL